MLFLGNDGRENRGKRRDEKRERVESSSSPVAPLPGLIPSFLRDGNPQSYQSFLEATSPGDLSSLERKERKNALLESKRVVFPFPLSLSHSTSRSINPYIHIHKSDTFSSRSLHS